MTPRTRKAPKVDAYQLVTDRILGALKEGVVPWHKPWKTVANGPLSLTTRKPYRGINVFILGSTAMVSGYTSRWWGTYKQISERGGQVRRGEKSTPIVFWTFVGEEKNAAGVVVKRGIPFLRHYSVFNADQCDDLTVPDLGEPEPEHVEPIDECEAISLGYQDRGGPRVVVGGNSAHFIPARDIVGMPTLEQFETAEHYYGALFHEFGHSTGTKERLNRPGITDITPFGTEDYSREELIAEMTAAFVCGEAGIDVNVPFRASYIANWMQALTDDPKIVVVAGGQAQKAADLILGLNGHATEVEEANDENASARAVANGEEQ